MYIKLGSTEYAFDASDNLYGQLSQVTQSAGGGNSVTSKTVNFSYYYDGQFNTVSRLDYASNEVITGYYGYDNAGNLNAIWYAQGNLVYDAFQWVYDPAGDISDEYSLVDTAGTPTMDPTTWNHVQYAYDATHQLTAEAYSNYTIAPADQTFQYDPNGNLKTSGQPGDGIGGGNEVANDGTYSYEYDQNGNCVLRTRLADGTLTGYQWDNRNRLIEVDSYASLTAYNAQAPGQSVRYFYDYANRWLGETVTSYAGGAGTLVSAREFAYDGDEMAMQFNASGALAERYLWNPAAEQVLAQESPQNAGEVDWALTDKLGTVVDIVATNGATWIWAQHRIMDAFDQTRSTQQNMAVDMIFAAWGRPIDEATGLVNNLNRWYDPNTHRMLSPDPDGLRPDANPYRYCGNDPTGGTDPSGLAVPGDRALPLPPVPAPPPFTPPRGQVVPTTGMIMPPIWTPLENPGDPQDPYFWWQPISIEPILAEPIDWSKVAQSLRVQYTTSPLMTLPIASRAAGGPMLPDLPIGEVPGMGDMASHYGVVFPIRGGKIGFGVPAPAFHWRIPPVDFSNFGSPALGLEIDPYAPRKKPKECP
jgi:RHS repeat-associated protein